MVVLSETKGSGGATGGPPPIDEDHLMPSPNSDASSSPMMCNSDTDDSSCAAAVKAKSSSTDSVLKNVTVLPVTPTPKTDSEKDAAKEEKCFIIYLHVPGVEPFKLQVSSLELIHEIHQILMDREETCHRTCFSLQVDGTTLDNFQDVSTASVIDEGSAVRLVEEPYSMRECRLHIRHFHDLLNSFNDNKAYEGIEGMSLTIVTAVTDGDLAEKKKSTIEDYAPPPTLHPDATLEQPLTMLTPHRAAPSPCLRAFAYSAYNPPTSNRLLHGDLVYLEVVTLEEKTFYITGAVRGFYLNASTDVAFNPRPQPNRVVYHSLADLLASLSPQFKKNFSILLRRRSQIHPFEKVPTSQQTYLWTAPDVEAVADSFNLEDAFHWRYSNDEQIPCQARDFNEEIQTAKELPRDTLPQRVVRDRARIKIDSDFIQMAIKGARCVVDGNIMSINPGEKPQNQMFIWNNIFFSYGFDVKDHFKEFGGDKAAFVAPANDIKGVEAYASHDIEGLYTLGTAVIDYKGYRVTAQSIIPGILEKEQEESVVYGSVDFGKTIQTNDKYEELLKPAATQLKLRQHKLRTADENVVNLCSSVDTKGIIGNDRRLYLLDLLSSTPTDLNFRADLSGVDGCSDMARAKGFPYSHPHILATLRHDLVDSFVEEKYFRFVSIAADRVKNELTDSMDEEVSQTKTKEIIGDTCKQLGSLDDSEFDFSFNPDLHHPHATLADASDDISRQKALLREACDFLIDRQIPGMIEELKSFQVIPLDGANLCEHMHRYGINIRYIGYIADELRKIESLSFAFYLCVNEILAKSVKHIFSDWIRSIEPTNHAAAVALFLNCVFDNVPRPSSQVINEDVVVNGHHHNGNGGGGGGGMKQKRRHKHSKKLIGHNWSVFRSDWTELTSPVLWREICEEAESYYHFSIQASSFKEVIERFKLQYVSFLRTICKRTGIQIATRDYFLDKQHLAFHEQDIISFNPIVKCCISKTTDAYSMLHRGQALLSKGEFKAACELLSDAHNVFASVYGPLHPDICIAMKLLSRISYISNDHGEAMVNQQRLLMMAERVYGLDHAILIPEYCILSLYILANGLYGEALRALYRARYLSLLCHTRDHPYIAMIDTQISIILLGVNQSSLSLKYLRNALDLYRKFFGKQSEQVALAHHLQAKIHAYHGDFKQSLSEEGLAYDIYKAKYGQEDERSKESFKLCQWYTSLAIEMQKALKSSGGGGKALGSICLPPLTLQSLLEMLNVVHGFQSLSIRDRIVFEGPDGKLYYRLNSLNVPLSRNAEEFKRSPAIFAISGDSSTKTRSSPAKDDGEPTNNIEIALD